MSRGFPAGELLADQPVDVTLSAPKLLARGFRDYERWQFKIAGEHGASTQTRDVLRFGKVAAVLPLDLSREEIIVIRQFRLPEIVRAAAAES